MGIPRGEGTGSRPPRPGYRRVRAWGVRAVAAAALLAGYAALAAWLPPFEDELYYWCWARGLQPSYFDHPPMTALLIRPSLELFGDSVLAVRLPAVLANLVVLGVLWAVTRPRGYARWALAAPPFTLGAVVGTPDSALLLFWALYLGCLVAVHRRLAPAAGPGGPVPAWLWAAAGLALGGAGLSKYTALLLVPAGFVSFVSAGLPWRRWLPGYPQALPRGVRLFAVRPAEPSRHDLSGRYGLPLGPGRPNLCTRPGAAAGSSRAQLTGPPRAGDLRVRPLRRSAMGGSPLLLAAAVAAPALKDRPAPPALVGEWEAEAFTTAGPGSTAHGEYVGPRPRHKFTPGRAVALPRR